MTRQHVRLMDSIRLSRAPSRHLQQQSFHQSSQKSHSAAVVAQHLSGIYPVVSKMLNVYILIFFFIFLEHRTKQAMSKYWKHTHRWFMVNMTSKELPIQHAQSIISHVSAPHSNLPPTELSVMWLGPTAPERNTQIFSTWWVFFAVPCLAYREYS